MTNKTATKTTVAKKAVTKKPAPARTPDAWAEVSAHNKRRYKGKVSGLTPTPDVKAERAMKKADSQQLHQRIAQDMLKHELVVYANVGVNLNHQVLKDALFPVSDQHECVTGLMVTAHALHELVLNGVLVRRNMDGVVVFHHKHDRELGVGRPTVNHGLPKNVSIKRVKPGAMLTVRFFDNDGDLKAILIDRDSTTDARGGDVCARVLLQLDGSAWDKRSITLSQIVTVGDTVDTLF